VGVSPPLLLLGVFSLELLLGAFSLLLLGVPPLLELLTVSEPVELLLDAGAATVTLPQACVIPFQTPDCAVTLTATVPVVVG
jgi:hypothetical protein